MAEYKAIHGFTVQNRTSDPKATGIAGATWATGGALNTGRSAMGSGGTNQSASIVHGGGGEKEKQNNTMVLLGLKLEI